MPNLHRLSPTVLLMLCGLSCAPVALTADSAEPKEESSLISLDFPGGSLSDFARALEASYRKPVNLVMPDHTAVPVPAIRVTDVSLSQVFAAIGTVEPRITFQEVRTGPTDEGVWALQTGMRVHEPQLARSYSVDQLLEKYNINDITTAVKTAWDMRRAGDPDAASGRHSGGAQRPEPELKFHQETKLLIIRGTGPDLALAENVIGQLSQALNAARAPSRSPEEIAALQANALDLEASRLSLQAELQELKKSTPDHPQIDATKARLRAVEARIKMVEAATNARPN